MQVRRVHVDRRSHPGAFVDPEYVLTLVRGGRCAYRIADRRHLVVAGDLILLRPHLPHLLVPEGAVDHLVVHIAAAAGDRWLGACPELVHLSGRGGRACRRWLEDLARLWPQHGPEVREQCRCLAEAALRHLHARRDAAPAAVVDRAGGWPLVERALALMQAEYATAIDAAGIARRLDVSAEHLSRLFARHTGQGPARFLLDLRLDRARELLHAGELSCAAIAAACGFASAAVFSRAFRRRLGRSPTEWRAELGRGADGGPPVTVVGRQRSS